MVTVVVQTGNGGEDQSFDCQLKPANNSLTCSYSFSHNAIEVENG